MREWLWKIVWQKTVHLANWCWVLISLEFLIRPHNVNYSYKCICYFCTAFEKGAEKDEAMGYMLSLCHAFVLLCLTEILPSHTTYCNTVSSQGISALSPQFSPFPPHYFFKQCKCANIKYAYTKRDPFAFLFPLHEYVLNWLRSFISSNLSSLTSIILRKQKYHNLTH